MTAPYLVALVVSLPFLVWGLVSLGVGLVTVFACFLGRNDPRDHVQERAYVERRANVFRRGWWLMIEGLCQTLSFVLQGLHLIRRRLPPPPPHAPESTPLILVAGYLENSGQMYVLGARLRARGFVVIHRDLPSTLHSIDTNATWLRAEVASVCAAAGAKSAAIIGHSMGGVIGRTLVHKDPCAPVNVVVSIASPHRGTHMGRLGFGPSARDMVVGSDHCARYPSPRGAPCHIPVHSVVGFQEDIVSPYWSSLLDGEGENVVLDVPAGHVAPMFMPSVADLVERWLDAAGVKRAGTVATTTTSVAA